MLRQAQHDDLGVIWAKSKHVLTSVNKLFIQTIMAVVETYKLPVVRQVTQILATTSWWLAGGGPLHSGFLV